MNECTYEQTNSHESIELDPKNAEQSKRNMDTIKTSDSRSDSSYSDEESNSSVEETYYALPRYMPRKWS